MGKHTITKQRYSHQTKLVSIQQEPTFVFLKHLKYRNMNTNVSFRPLATSTPYVIQQSHSLNNHSRNSIVKQQPLITPPIFSSTPKQIRRQQITSSTVKRKLPIVISQRHLQFNKNSQSILNTSLNKSQRWSGKDLKIWLV